MVKELNYCRKLYRENPAWGVIDVTGRSVEEVAAEVMERIRQGENLD
ncbi:MAG: kinase/pyrophosphorylase [Nitrospiria bacterium]